MILLVAEIAEQVLGRNDGEKNPKYVENGRFRFGKGFDRREGGRIESGMRKLSWVTLVSGVFLTACSYQDDGIPEVTAEMAKEYEVPEATLARGRGIYMAHCAECHERVEPGKVDPEFWRGVTPHMAVKAKLSDEEEKQLLQYLMVAHAEVHGLMETGL